MPDVVGLNDIDVPSFAREHALMNITKYVNALPTRARSALATCSSPPSNGHYFGVPYLADLSVLWYNKALFKQAGLNPNAPPTNYAQIVSDAEKISALGHGIYGFSFAGNCQGCLGFTMLPSLWAAGQHMLNGPLGTQKANVASDAPLKEMLADYQIMWSKHLVPRGRPDPGRPDLGPGLRGRQGRHPARRLRLRRRVQDQGSSSPTSPMRRCQA